MYYFIRTHFTLSDDEPPPTKRNDNKDDAVFSLERNNRYFCGISAFCNAPTQPNPPNPAG